MRTAAAARIAMLTDVEGDWQYVRNVLLQSSCLCLTSSGQDETLELRDDCKIEETTHLKGFGRPDVGARGQTHDVDNFLATEQKKEDGNGANDTIKAANSKTNRLKWILEHTLAAQGDFERRRTELMLRQDVDDVTDKNVVKSYVENVMEGGALREFLLHGSLAFVAHQTLFVHGGIIDGDKDASLSALGRVPDEPSKHFNSTQLRLKCLKMEFDV
ncbi:unnamed protein product [Peronospora destructor]|uniref:Uncharacterized protein n=1 Tax=Peronospora destructor TaxID=86335 RepID=A0AAV0TVC6_9STRA|nr:unnamed protein product [Peronospora destructor]